MSSEYIYFYYYSDAILTICLYFALMGLYAIVFEELGVSYAAPGFHDVAAHWDHAIFLQRRAPIRVANAHALHQWKFLKTYTS